MFKSLALALLLAVPAMAATSKSEVKELDKIPRLHPEYPLPAEPNQVFYIERSSNSNTVIYAANLDKDGKLQKDEPITAFWRWYNVDGHKKSLNFVERMMAYGIKSVKHDGPNGSYSFKVAAMPERTLYIGLDAKGTPEVFTKFGNRWATISYIYLEVVDKGLMPDVPSLDLFGIDRENGKALHEHITRQ
ncbi:hypothetical protein FHS83_000702 [Rhizomicrobium palustre]|jgi:hypothetical protein|uniref:DUF4833 domain-containing protein n=1 Tax=Rhizomicrobium palustre TaxID=189966 RepID=A0A846MV96_9PROT|nr:DUF4833 domain-containing protein [Rhizomicrobium palustre]NIK87384.1 hypothetical protein [Rhizomicrobium palustre]